MATLILQGVGAYIGSAVTSLGAYLIDRAFSGTMHVEGPRLAAMKPMTAEEGPPCRKSTAPCG